MARSFLALFAVLFFVPTFTAMPSRAEALQQEGVFVSALMRRRPIGILGKPLGTRMTIQGTAAERVLLSNPMLIAQVDGEPLRIMIPIEIVGVKQLSPRVPYKFEGYETGGFVGSPSWASSAAQVPFQYRSSFVVTREVIEPLTIPSDI